MLKIDMHAHILPEDWPDLGHKYIATGFPSLERKDGRFASSCATASSSAKSGPIAGIPSCASVNMQISASMYRSSQRYR